MPVDCCCPQNSWPRLKTNYHSKGEKLQIANTTCYHVGEGNQILLMVSDIWGSKSGNHQSLADTFSNFGYNVYLPQILTQPFIGINNLKLMIECVKNQKFNIMRERFFGIAQYLEEKGHKKFFVLGFCWGVWFAFKMAAQMNNIIAIAGMHPALALQNTVGGDLNKLAKDIRCPAYLFPARNDPCCVKSDSEFMKILIKRFGYEKVGNHEFPEMSHGWVVRGDTNLQKVRRDVQKAIDMCRTYFQIFN